MRASVSAPLGEKDASSMVKMLEMLEDLDDVQERVLQCRDSR